MPRQDYRRPWVWKQNPKLEDQAGEQEEFVSADPFLEAPLTLNPPETIQLSKRKRTASIRWIEESSNSKYAGLASTDFNNEEPEDYEEALSSPQAKQWMLAMEEEIACLLKDETWILVTLPPGRKPIKNKWVYNLKRVDDGAILRFKAKLVAEGSHRNKE